MLSGEIALKNNNYYYFKAAAQLFIESKVLASCLAVLFIRMNDSY